MFKYSLKYLDTNSNQFLEINSFTRGIRNKDTLDETHEESKVFLNMDTREEAFKPFTHFIIQIDEVNDAGEVVDSRKLYRVLGSDTVRQLTFTEPFYYSHDMELLDPSKELERYNLDNTAFTNSFAALYLDAYAQFNESLVYTDAKYGDGILIKDDLARENIAINSITNQMVGRIEYRAQYSVNSAVDLSTMELRTGLRDVERKLGPSTFSSVAHYFTDYTLDKVVLVDPNGVETVLNKDNPGAFTFTKLGTYKLRYEVDIFATKHVKDWLGIPLYYDYNHVLVANATREYDLIIVPSATRTTTALSIYDVLNRITEICPTRFYSQFNQQDKKFQLANGLYEKYSKLEAPEFIFSGKNLWEVLVEIGGKINAIPFLNISSDYEWNVIDFFDLGNPSNEAATVEHDYNSYSNNYDTENYCANFDVYADNMLSANSRILDQSSQFGKSYRSETVEISEDDFVIPTVFPIYKVRSLKWRRQTDGAIFDISSRVLSETTYNNTPGYPQNEGDFNWKGFLLYFTPNQKNIRGLNYKVSSNIWQAASSKIAIKNILNWAENASDFSSDGDFSLNGNQFIIEYETLFNSRVQIFKTNAPELKLTGSLYQSQSANIIDATQLGRRLASVLGKTGNRDDEEDYRVSHLNQLPNVGDLTSDKYFVNTIETNFDREYITGHISFIKQYQKISEYININSQQRYYQISENQALDRYVNTNVFYVFSSKKPSEDFLQSTHGLNVDYSSCRYNYMALLLNDKLSREGSTPLITGSFLAAYGWDGTYNADGSKHMGNISRLWVPTISTAIGNSIVLATDMEDNYSAGLQATDFTKATETQGYLNRAVRYCDEDGYIDYINVRNGTDMGVVYDGSDALKASMIQLGKQLPDVTGGDQNLLRSRPWTEYEKGEAQNNPTYYPLGAWQQIILNKDSREVIKLRQGFHFLTEDSDIIIGPGMTERCRFVNKIGPFNTKVCCFNRRISPYDDYIKESDITWTKNITKDNINTILSTERTFKVEPDENGENQYVNLPYIIISPEYNAERPNLANINAEGVSWGILTGDNQLILAYNCGDFSELEHYIPNIYYRTTDDYLKIT